MTIACLVGIMGCATTGTTTNDSLKQRQFDAQRNLGNAYLRQGDYTTALKELLKAEAMDPKDPHVQDSLGIIYSAKDRLEEAIEHYRKALSLKPDYASARNNLGSVYLIQKKWDEAISCLKPLTRNLLFASPQLPLYNLGWAYYNKHDYKMAEKYYQKALDMAPGYARALWGLGKIDIDTGKLHEAQRQLEAAVKSAPDYAQAYLDLGWLYFETGQRDKAVSAYKKVMSLSSDSDTRLAKSAQEALQEIQGSH
jgi:type IV pilus biogenesis/stability protein PilW